MIGVRRYAPELGGCRRRLFLYLSPCSVIMDFDFPGGGCALREGKGFLPKAETWVLLQFAEER